jgi:aerobic carbon-monoxide dehydrogenase medium subunit
MYAASFDYFRADSVAEAQQLLRKHPGAKLVAGGHSLIPLLKLRLASPPALIDIGRLAELKGIVARDGAIRVGALTTHAELAASDALRAACPMLAEAAAAIGDQQVRNCGTIGGNVAHADPASDLPTVLSALEARFTVSGAAGERTIVAGDFFQGLMATALRDDEILTAIEIAPRKAGEGMAYAKFVHPASRYAVVGAAAVVLIRDGACRAARISLGGLVPAPTRARAVESALTGARPTAETIGRAAAETLKELTGEVLEDLYASAEYRRAMAVVYVKRALAAAFDRAAA